MEFAQDERTKQICKDIKKLLMELEETIQKNQITLEIEVIERPAAGIKEFHPNTAGNHWACSLRTNNWFRKNNY
jgi:hypothetical protein